MGSLRSHLLISHSLPLLLLVPLMGLALIYTVESQVLLPTLSQELTSQAALLSRMTSVSPTFWDEPTEAQAFVAEVSPLLGTRVMLLDTQGTLLASSEPDDRPRLGQRLTFDGLEAALAGESIVHQRYSPSLQTEVTDLLLPVWDSRQEVVGVIRLSQRLATVYDRFRHLRVLILLTQGVGLLVGASIGGLLTLIVVRPIRQVTQAVSQLARREPLPPLPTTGPHELRHLALAVNALMEQLRSLEEARHHLLANLVHELGRPLGSLTLAVEALREGAAEPLRTNLLAGMAAELRRLHRLTDDLASLHDQVLGQYELHLTPCAAAPWLTELLAPWQAVAHRKGLRWQSDIPPELPTLVLDPDRLGQALGNLLANAITYTPTEGTVTVGAGVGADTLWIRIEDTGPGVSVPDQIRLFEPFWRGPTGRRFPQGMGLGLSIAQTLVVAHGGWLEVSSESGRGSQFTLHLPLRPAR